MKQSVYLTAAARFWNDPDRANRQAGHTEEPGPITGTQRRIEDHRDSICGDEYADMLRAAANADSAH